MEHFKQPSTSKNCTVLRPSAFVNPGVPTSQPPFRSSANDMIIRHGALPHYSPAVPLVPLIGAGPQRSWFPGTAQHPPPPIYIAQPININLEVNPKIHLPVATTIAVASLATENNGHIATSTPRHSRPSVHFNAPPPRPTSLLVAHRIPPPTVFEPAPVEPSTSLAVGVPPTAPTHSGDAATPTVALVDGAAGDCWNTAVTGWEVATLIKNKIGLVVNQRYKILQSIASGSYGAIFVGEDLWSESKRRVAVKFDAACRDDHLKYEFDVYKSVLYDDGTGKVDGFPRVYWYGHEYGHNILVMELLGAPLASLFAFCDRRFGKETIISLGVQMIERLRHLHRRGFIHRDIKPENFLMGLSDRENTCYLIDFGLARRYRFRENRDLRHIPFRRGRSFVGTAKYASLNSHKGIELSRRDDLESLGYVLIELINGNLPWKHISKRNTAYTRHQTSMKIRMIKEQTAWAEICPSMAKFINYCRQLPFLDDPDYDILLDLVRAIDFVERPERVPKPMSDKVRCESCDALLKAPMMPPLMAAHMRGVLPPQTQLGALPAPMPISAAGVIVDDGSAVIPQISGISSGNLLCQIPYTLIKPVEECVASLRSLSIAAAAAATSVNAAVSIPGTAMPISANSAAEAAIVSFGPPAVIPSELAYSATIGSNSPVIIPPDPVTGNASTLTDDDDSDIVITCRRCRQRLEQDNQHLKSGKTEPLFQSDQKRDTVITPPNDNEILNEDIDSESQPSHPEHTSNEDPETEPTNHTSVAEVPQQLEQNQQQKMSWQIWRESTLDRRFQYENRFSWTLARKSKTSPQKAISVRKKSQSHFTLDGIEYDMSIPPPPLPNSTMGATRLPPRRRHKTSANSKREITSSLHHSFLQPQPMQSNAEMVPTSQYQLPPSNAKLQLQIPPPSRLPLDCNPQNGVQQTAVVPHFVASVNMTNIPNGFNNTAMIGQSMPMPFMPAPFLGPMLATNQGAFNPLLTHQLSHPPSMNNIAPTSVVYSPQQLSYMSLNMSTSAMNVQPR